MNHEKTAVDEIPVEVETQPSTISPITDDYIFRLTDTMKSGGEYLIVSKNVAGSAYALKNDGGSSDGTSLNKAPVTIYSADVDNDGTADLYISSPSISTIWTATTNADGFDLANDEEYLEGKSGKVYIYDYHQYPERYWTYSNYQLHHEGGQNTYTVYYSDQNFTSTYNDSDEKVYLFEKIKV